MALGLSSSKNLKTWIAGNSKMSLLFNMHIIRVIFNIETLWLKLPKKVLHPSWQYLA